MWYSKRENETGVAEEVSEINKYLTDSNMMGLKARAVADLEKRQFVHTSLI